MSKTLVTGGTGLVGAHLLYHLTQLGITTIAIKRKRSNIQNVKKIFNYYTKNGDQLFEQIIWKNCDILDMVLLEDIIKDVQHIYHCAALISFNNALKKEMIEINSVGTSNIIDLAIKHNVGRFCYVSSIATLGSNDGLPVDENCHWNWENKSGYAISKYLAEMEVWRGFAEGLNGFIVNPSLIMGPGMWDSGFGIIIKKGQMSGPFYAPGICGVIEVNDLVEIMIALMKSKVNHDRFIINSEHISYKQILKIIAEELNTASQYIKLAPIIMKIFVFIDIFISKIQGKKIELSVDAIKYTTQDIRLESSKVNDVIKHNYRNIETSLRRCIQIFKKELVDR
jgi:dihydroflavonol-4-reductase